MEGADQRIAEDREMSVICSLLEFLGKLQMLYIFLVHFFLYSSHPAICLLTSNSN